MMQRSGSGLKSDMLCEKLKNELGDLKSTLTKECDDILNKIDDLLNTEVLTFDKASDYRQTADDALQTSETMGVDDSPNFDFYNLE